MRDHLSRRAPTLGQEGYQDGGMDHCQQCGFRYDDVVFRELADQLRLLGTAYRSQLEAGVHDAQVERLLRTRPGP